LRPSKEIDDIDSTSRKLADGPLVDHDSFEFFVCNECARKPGNEALLHYVGHKGWIVCLPTGDHYLPDSVDEISAITVEAKGQDWSQKWKIFGLEGSPMPVAESEKAGTESSSLVKRKMGEEEPSESAKRVKNQNGLEILDTFSDASQEDAAIPVIGKDDEEEECFSGAVPLFAKPDAKPARLDIFLTETFRQRICRCKGVSTQGDGGCVILGVLSLPLSPCLCQCAMDFEKLPFLLEAEETYSPPRSERSSQIDNDGQSEGGASQNSSTYDLGLAALQKLPRAQMMESLEAYNKMRDALFAHLRPFASEGRVVDGESLREFFRKQREDRRT
jgi:E3 ubiquitin-protein ligase UBR7